MAASAAVSHYHQLTQRRRNFVDHYVECGVGAEAVRRAKLPGKRPDQAAWKYLNEPEIRLAVEERSALAIEEAGVRAVNLIRAIADTAFFDPAVLQDQNGNMLPLSKIPARYRQSISAMEVEEVTKDNGKGKRKTTLTRIKRYRFESRDAARDKLGQFMKLWQKKAELAPAGGQALLPKAEGNDLDTARRIAYLLDLGMRTLRANTALNPAPDSVDEAEVIDDSTSNSN